MASNHGDKIKCVAVKGLGRIEFGKEYEISELVALADGFYAVVIDKTDIADGWIVVDKRGRIAAGNGVVVFDMQRTVRAEINHNSKSLPDIVEALVRDGYEPSIVANDNWDATHVDATGGLAEDPQRMLERVEFLISKRNSL